MVADEDVAEQAARATKAGSAGRGLGATVKNQIVELENAVEKRSTATQRPRQEARSTEAGLGYTGDGRPQQVRGAARDREKLGEERERSSRVHLELEVGAVDLRILLNQPGKC